jgi:hypothetical protein
MRKASSDVQIDIKLSTIKPIHASWIVAAFQQVTKETLIRGWEKHVHFCIVIRNIVSFEFRMN